MDARQSPSLVGAVEELERYGLLLLSDRALPSVVTLITGGPVAGSWWGHPSGQEIYTTTRELADHPDVVVTKIVSGKTTYVHRRLWPALIAIGSAREPWQLEGLSLASRDLLELIAKDGEMRTDEVPPHAETWGDVARDLERRLLVHSEEIHTDSGRHAKRLQTWKRWATGRVGAAPRSTSQAGKKAFEDLLSALNTQFGTRGHLPWASKSG
jgi:hypothetical protein